MEYVVETFGLTKRFTQTKGFIDLFRPSRIKEVIAIEDVNLKIKKGELFGILGPNGAGKTTFIKILCTLILPTAGSAFVNGYNIVKEEENARASIGFVSGDERSFYWRLTGRQNLEFFSSLYNIPDPNRKVNEVLDYINLKDKADDKFHTYSAGMKQRMAIARGLLNDPEILFMDEPSRSLDPGAAQHLRTFIKEQLVDDQKKTIILSTHHLDEAEQLCDRIAIMDKGRIRACGNLGDLRKMINIEESYYLEVKGLSEDALTQIKEIGGINYSLKVNSDVFLIKIGLSQNDLVLSQLIETIVNAGGKIIACNTRKPTLNEVFAKLMIGREEN